eukprot:gene5317-10630_t
MRTSIKSKDSGDGSLLGLLWYKPELHRGLGAITNFSLGFTEVAVVASICGLYSFGLETGGPSSMIWGWIISFAMTMVIAFSMAEICAAYPSAGSVYNWAGQVVPSKWKPVVSYTCGTCNVLGNVAGDAFLGYTCAKFLNCAFITSNIAHLNSESEVAVSIVFLLSWCILNALRVDRIGWFMAVAGFFQFATIILIVSSIFSLDRSKFNSMSFIFTKFENDTGFNNAGYVTLISILTALFSFSGYEASSQMAEETNNAKVNAPLGIIYTVFATGILGLILLFSFLLITTDINTALNTNTGFPIIEIIIQTLGKKYGATFSWLIMVNVFFGGLSSVTVTSRITFALVRDNAFPHSQFLSKIHPTLHTPINIIIIIFLFNVLLQLLPLDTAGNTAFVSFTGVATAGFQVSYGIPILARLIFHKRPFPQTDMSLGSYSKLFGSISCLWLFSTSILFFLPTKYPVTPATMNWTIVVVAIFFILASLNWYFYAQFVFIGPLRASEENSCITSYDDNTTSHVIDNRLTESTPLTTSRYETF